MSKEKAPLSETNAHLLECAMGLAYDWMEILKSAKKGARSCRSSVLHFSKAHVATIAEIASVVQGGKMGEMLEPEKASDK